MLLSLILALGAAHSQRTPEKHQQRNQHPRKVRPRGLLWCGYMVVLLVAHSRRTTPTQTLTYPRHRRGRRRRRYFSVHPRVGAANGIRERAVSRTVWQTWVLRLATLLKTTKRKGLWKTGSRRGTSLAPVAFGRHTLITSERLRLFDSTACQANTATSYAAALSRQGICGITHYQQRQNDMSFGCIPSTTWT